ncbi:MAG: M48 family metallopeptidase, partial [Anaerolineales bacterium]
GQQPSATVGQKHQVHASSGEFSHQRKFPVCYRLQYNPQTMTSYRYPNERLILALTLLLVFAVIAVTAVATVCGSVVFVLGMLVLSYMLNRSQHNRLIEKALPITPQNQPKLARLVADCGKRLRSGTFQTFIAPQNVLNAYTFGLVEPQVVVVYAGVLRIMDVDELRFVIGHELGHVGLGHTVLNSLVGGLAGIPSPYFAAAVLYIAFRWWNRACEYSADRAGLLACGNPEKAVSALIKMETGASAALSAEGWRRALSRIEAEDDHLEGNLRELISTHPMTVRRLEALRKYAASVAYQRLQAKINETHPIRSHG